MEAIYFRFMTNDGRPSGWVGLAVAKDKKGLIDAIDEYGDPYSVEVQKVKSGGFALQWKEFPDGSGESITDAFEFSEQTPHPFEEDGWVIPEWIKQ